MGLLKVDGSTIRTIDVVYDDNKVLTLTATHGVKYEVNNSDGVVAMRTTGDPARLKDSHAMAMTKGGRQVRATTATGMTTSGRRGKMETAPGYREAATMRCTAVIKNGNTRMIVGDGCTTTNPTMTTTVSGTW